MKSIIIVFALVALAPFGSFAAWEVLFRNPGDVDAGWSYSGQSVSFVRVPDMRAARVRAEATGNFVGRFPALLDTETRRWVHVDGGLDAAAVLLLSANADSEAADQASKSPRLVQAENKLIKFLRDEGAIAAGAVLATADEIDAMFANLEATLNDAQLDKKSAKYDRLLRAVERRGGTESGARYH